MKKSRQILSLILLFGVAGLALSATYKYQNESGGTVYSQNPPEDPATPYEVLGDIPSHARPGSDTPSYPAPSMQGDSQEDEGEADTVINQQMEEGEKIRQKNCAAAKKNLEIYTASPRIRNEEGEVVRLDDQVRQQKIEEAKQAIRDFCQ